MIDYSSVRREILVWVAKTTRVPVEQIDVYKPFRELGLDSLDAVDMIATIERLIQQELPENVIARTTCLNDILEMMRVRVAAA
jgi:acyl carrier protein